MSTVLVTGYGGFLGREVTRQLRESGYDVVGVARGDYPELAGLGIRSIRGDICNRNFVQEIVCGCRAIVHTAAKAGIWGALSEYYRINTLATSHLLDAAHRAGVQAFVYTSSPSVTFNGQHQSGADESEPYASRWLCYYPQTKALAEHAVLQAANRGQIATCALRPHLIWGPGDPHLFPRVIERARQGKLRCVGSGKNLIDVVHVRSAARAHVQAVDKLLAGDQALNGQPLLLTDDEPIECWQWISRILELAGVAVPRRAISFSAAYRLGALIEATYRLFRIQREPPMTRFVAARMALDHYYSIDRAKTLLGYRPDVDRDRELEQCRRAMVSSDRGWAPS